MPGKITEGKIPLQKMTFSPDVPSNALGPNEYNSGFNVETDVRGIRSVAGDEQIFDSVPGTPTFITGGYRADGEFWYIVAVDEGHWYASYNGTWIDITPATGPFANYTQAVNITEAWNGTIPFFNDSLNPPMVWLDGADQMTMYSNTLPIGISDITYNTPTTLKIDLSGTQASAPFVAGEKITISGINNFFNGTYTVVSSTTTEIIYTATLSAAYPGGGTVSPQYSWNYNPNWKQVYAGWMRLYSTPNVGSILVAGNLTALAFQNFQANTTSGNSTIITSSASYDFVGGTVLGNAVPANTTVVSVVPGISMTLSNNVSTTYTLENYEVDYTQEYPVTVQWSQAFGLNQAPSTWTPTVTNVANQLEVPLRGPALDAFPSNGQLFLCSYWDTVVFSPLNYSTTSAPILGVRLYNQGRGLLSSNCWANTDDKVYGIDARDIWVFDGQNFMGLGNQRVKNWFYDQLDPLYVDRVFLEINTQKNQVEIYYPTTSATNGVPNKMLSYRYDLDIWNAPRDIDSATFACESPIWTGNTFNYGSRTVAYVQGKSNGNVILKDQGFSWANGAPISSEFRRDNFKLLPDYSYKVFLHRILPEVVNLDQRGVEVNPGPGNLTVTIGGSQSVGGNITTISAANIAVATDYPWMQFNQNSSRTNSVLLQNSSNVHIWMCNSISYQYTPVEDDR